MTGVQTCALPIYEGGVDISTWINAGLPAGLLSQEKISSVPVDHQGLSVEQNKKGDREQKLLSPAVNADQNSPAGPCDKEISEMLNLFEKISARIEIGFRRQSIYLHIPDKFQGPEQHDDRYRLSQLVFLSGAPADLLNLLEEEIGRAHV